MSTTTAHSPLNWLLPASWSDLRDDLHAMYAPPAWARGAITRADAEFLAQTIAVLQPRTVVEIGVASGVSSAVILQALDRLPEIDGGRLLQSCDIVPSCYFDDQHATGSAALTMYPTPRARWNLDTNIDTRRLSQVWAADTIDLTFIDANHYHPWPLLDLLHVTYVAKPRSWVVLHDVDLPRRNPKIQVHGALWLFEAWPFATVQGTGASSNIGAVQLPDDPADLVPMALELLERTWEHLPTMWHVALPGPLEPVERVVRARIEAASHPEDK
jgi:predicted O-methyltransferase YrrM